MLNVQVKNAARVAAAAGLGLTLAFTAAPVVAMAEGTVASAPAADENSDGGIEAADGTLQSLINNAEGSEVTIALTEDVSENISIPEGKTVTLNLGSFTLSNNGAEHTISNKGTLIVNADEGGKVTNNAAGHAALANYPDSVATLNGGTFEDNTWYTIKNLGSLTINKGVSVTRTDAASSMIDNGWYGNTGNDLGLDSSDHTDVWPTLTINGGTFSGGMNTIKNDDRGIAVINNGTFTNTAGPVLMNWNECTVTGGTFTGTASDKPLLSNGCIAGGNDKGLLTITGGTFTASSEGHGALFGHGVGSTEGEGKVSITGGTFAGTVSDQSDDAYKIVITGGSFTGTVDSACIASGMKKDDEGKIVIDYEKAVATVDGAAYSTLSEAIDAAQPGDTVKLLDNVECGAITVPAGVTLDGGNKTLTLNTKLEKGAFVTAGGNDVVIKNVTIDTNDNAKHGVQFYKVEGGSLDGVTVNGGNFTSVIVNGSTGISIKDSTLNPGENAYANIEFAMGGGVTTVPTITIDGVDFGEADHDIWVDDDTVTGIKSVLGGSATDSDVLDKVNGSITNLGSSDIKVDVELEAEKVTTVVSEGKKPIAPSEGEHAVKVEQAEGGKVVVTPTTADKGDEVTISATPDKGQEVKSVTVTTKDGKKVKVTKGDKAGTWTFEMPDAEVTVAVEFGCDGGELCPTHKFDDVSADAWYHDAVDWAVEEGLLSGYADGKLGPDGTLSRAQLATVLWRQAGEPKAEGGLSFADCDPEAFYAEAVAWADEAGIIAGYGDGTNFGPEDPVTREQLATILWRQAGEPEGSGDLSGYPDGDEATDYAVPALEWAVDTGVLSGFGDGTLAPGGVLSRAMLAAMLQRMAE